MQVVGKIYHRTSQKVNKLYHKLNLDGILVLCQPLIEGYSFLSLIRASSVVNRQFTLAHC